MNWFLLSPNKIVSFVTVSKSAFGRMRVWDYEKGLCLSVLLNNN